jgi:xylulokinase
VEMMRLHPEWKTKIARYLHLNGWIAGKLTGHFAFDPANAAFSGLYTLFPKSGWSLRWCDYFGVRREWLPPVVPGETTLGGLSALVAKDLDLPAGLPVKLGSADTSSAWLAADAKEGELLHVAGTTQVLAAKVLQPSPGAKRLVRPLGVGSGFLHLTHNPVGGAALEWLRRLCFLDQTEQSYYDVTLDMALDRATMVRLDPPFLGGDRLEMDPKGAGFGPLTLATDRNDLLAAILNAMKHGHEEALRQLGVPLNFSRIHLTGGAAEIVRRLLPGYQSAKVSPFEEGSLSGITRLFHQSRRLT